MKEASWISNFINNEKSGGLILIACIIISIILANSPIAEHYFSIWHFTIANQPSEYWINDGLDSNLLFSDRPRTVERNIRERVVEYS